MKNLFVAAIIVCLGVFGHATRPKDSLNRFSRALYKELSEVQAENKFVSPFVTDLGLYMLCYGARGDTQNELNHVLGMNCEDQRSAYLFNRLTEILTRSNFVELRIAAKIFVSKLATINEDYEKYMNRHFNTGVVESVDFTKSSQAAGLINRWVDMKTDHNIPKLFKEDSFDGNTAMVLATAFFFNATWKNEFKRTERPMAFKNGGIEEQVPFMKTKQYLKAGTVEDLNAKFIKVPYKGNNFGMVIYLPNEGHKLEDLENNFVEVSTREILKIGHIHNYELLMPKFKIESSFELDSALQKMGVNHAYEDADFSGICANDIYLSKSIHKAVITVDEQGTEAVAACGFEIDFRSLVPPVKRFTVNRPFLFVILHEPTGLDLFVGSVYNPKMQ